MRNVLHYVVVLILVAVVTVLVSMGFDRLGLMPLAASAQAGPIDWLFDLEMKATAFFFALIMVPLLYSLVVFRRRKGETGDGEHFEGHDGLEIAWTIIPLIIVIALGIIGADNLRQVRTVYPQALEIGVIAHQWDWSFEYSTGFSSDELYLPVDKPVVLKMQSLDVIHSFWVIEFRVKQDVVPGRIVDYPVTPTLLGDYLIRCAELCGLRHAKMEKPVHVVSQAVYDKWFADQTAAYLKVQASGIPDATRGEKLYNQMGCKTCHSLDGSKGIGPTWKGLFGSKVKLADGTTVTADEAYLIESIKTPNAKTVQGFNANAMPNFGLILKELQIKDLVAFIETLK